VKRPLPVILLLTLYWLTFYWLLYLLIEALIHYFINPKP
jgi:hypothetical protein